MKQKKNGFFITILLLLISLAFIVTVSVVFNNIKTNLEREIISSLSEEAEENAALIEKEIDAKFGVLQSFANELSSTGDEIAEIRDMQSFVILEEWDLLTLMVLRRRQMDLKKICHSGNSIRLVLKVNHLLQNRFRRL